MNISLIHLASAIDLILFLLLITRIVSLTSKSIQREREGGEGRLWKKTKGGRVTAAASLHAAAGMKLEFMICQKVGPLGGQAETIRWKARGWSIALATSVRENEEEERISL